MSRSDLIGQTFDGYTLTEVVASGDDESLYLGERVRDGEFVWVRTARIDDPHVIIRLEQRYDAEDRAARRLASVGAILPVRETIRIRGAPGLVTGVPSGRSLNDRFAEQTSPWPLREMLPWFRKLMTAMEAAHEEGAAHGTLAGRAVFLDDDDRVTICGLAMVEGHRLEQAKRSDARALAALLYRGSTARAPVPGFPDTGMPPSPDNYVAHYPGSLGRFLRRRLAVDEQDDPVMDAGLFRRSVDALAVDPSFRKAVGLSSVDEDGGVGDTGGHPVKRRNRWRALLSQSLIITAFVALSVLATLMVMESRIENARLQSAAETARRNITRRDEPRAAETPRAAVWTCLVAALEPGSASLNHDLVDSCFRHTPSVQKATFLRELERIRSSLSAPVSDVRDRSLASGYRALFDGGADNLQRWVEYRRSRGLSVEGVEDWLQTHRGADVVAVLRTLGGRKGDAARWAKKLLSMAQSLEPKR